MTADWFTLWTLASICWTWGAIELLHSYFEAHEFDSERERQTVQCLRKVRAEHDSFGFGTYADDPELPMLRRLEERGYVTCERYNDGSGDCWWRATI